MNLSFIKPIVSGHSTYHPRNVTKAFAQYKARSADGKVLVEKRGQGFGWLGFRLCTKPPKGLRCFFTRSRHPGRPWTSGITFFLLQ